MATNANQLGINWDFPNEWAAPLFANCTIQARGWGTPAVPYDGKAAVGPDGWPVEDFGSVFAMSSGANDISGTYGLSFAGRAASVGGVNCAVQVSPLAFDPATNRTTATVALARGQAQLMLAFRGTRRLDRPAADAAGLTDVRLMRPVVPGGPTPYPPSAVFADQALAFLSPYTLVRTMNPTLTNLTDEAEWADRARPGRPLAGGKRGVAWEHLIQLANASGKDLWINLPARASDDYLRKLALLFAFGSDGVTPYDSPHASPAYPPLAMGRGVIVECANENWNWSLMSAHHHKDLAVKEVAAGGSPLNYDGSTDANLWAFRRPAARIVAASKAFRSVFGDAAMGTRIRPVICWQYDNLNDTAAILLRFLDDYYGNPKHVPDPRPANYHLWGAGAAWYASVDPATFAGGAVPNVPGQARWAAAHGLVPVGYEGGAVVGGDSPTPATLAANLDPRMEAPALEALRNFWRAGGAVGCVFASTGANYGQTDDLANLDTPKLRATRAFVKEGFPAAANLPVAPVPAPFAVAANFVGPFVGVLPLASFSAPAAGLYAIRLHGTQDGAADAGSLVVDGVTLPDRLQFPHWSLAPNGDYTRPVLAQVAAPGLHAIGLRWPPGCSRFHFTGTPGTVDRGIVPPNPGIADWLGTDAAAQGNWPGAYGQDGAVLVGLTTMPPPYATVAPKGHQQAIWSWATTDPRAPLKAAGKPDRFAAAWYGDGFTIDVASDQAQHTLAIYVVDWDTTARAQRIDVVDRSTGVVIDSRTISAFHGGVWLRWRYRGDITLKFTKTAGANAVASAIAFGPK